MATPFPLKNGSWFLVIEAPGGLYNTAQLKTIGEISEKDTAVVKITEGQRIGLMIEPALWDETEKKLASVGLEIRHYQEGWQPASACLGNLCPHHQQDALGLGMKLGKDDSWKGSPVQVIVNGCSRRCLPEGDLSFVGSEEGYTAYLKEKEISKNLSESDAIALVDQLKKLLPEPQESLKEAYERQSLKSEEKEDPMHQWSDVEDSGTEALLWEDEPKPKKVETKDELDLLLPDPPLFDPQDSSSSESETEPLPLEESIEFQGEEGLILDQEEKIEIPSELKDEKSATEDWEQKLDDEIVEAGNLQKPDLNGQDRLEALSELEQSLPFSQEEKESQDLLDDSKEKKSHSPHEEWSLAKVHTDKGQIVLEFGSGAQLKIDPKKWAGDEFQLGNHKISLLKFDENRLLSVSLNDGAILEFPLTL